MVVVIFLGSKPSISADPSFTVMVLVAATYNPNGFSNVIVESAELWPKINPPIICWLNPRLIVVVGLLLRIIDLLPPNAANPAAVLASILIPFPPVLLIVRVKFPEASVKPKTPTLRSMWESPDWPNPPLMPFAAPTIRRPPFIAVVPVYVLFPEIIQVPDPVLFTPVLFDEAKSPIFPANSPVPDVEPEKVSVLAKFPERARLLVKTSGPVPDWSIVGV